MKLNNVLLLLIFIFCRIQNVFNLQTNDLNILHKSNVHSIHTHILKTTFRNISACEQSEINDILCESFHIYELNSIRFNYPLTNQEISHFKNGVTSIKLKCNNNKTNIQTEDIFQIFSNFKNEIIEFPSSFNIKPPLLMMSTNLNDQRHLFHLLEYLDIQQESNEIILLSSFKTCKTSLSSCKCIVLNHNSSTNIRLNNIEEERLIRNLEIIIENNKKNWFLSNKLNKKLCHHKYPHFHDKTNIVAFLEESETAKGGMMSPFLDLFAQPGTDQINSIVTSAAVDDVSRNVGRTVQSNTPEVVTEHVAKALQDNITELATDAVTYKISKDITMLLTENIHPYLHTHIMEEVEPDVSLVLTEKLRQYVPHWLNIWIPMLLERSLAPALTGYVTRAVTNALTPAVILAVKQTYPQLFEYPVCHDTVCRYDNQVISKYYASMFSAYFSNYYQEYYIPYYQKAIVNVDDWVYTDKLKTPYPDAQMS